MFLEKVQKNAIQLDVKFTSEAIISIQNEKKKCEAVK
jgi:hypothetical protein